jgi:hypothetical protein
LQLRLDLSQLDPIPPDLHLMIVAPDVLDASIRAPAAGVTGPVHPRMGLIGEQVGHEAIRRQIRVIQVPACHARTTNVDLSDHAGRHRLAVGIQNVDPGTRHDMAHVGRFAADTATAGVHAAFRRSIHVEDDRFRGFREGPPGGLVNGFSTQQHLLQGTCAIAQKTRLLHHAQMRRRALDRLDAMSLEKRQQLFRVEARALWKQIDRAPEQQLTPGLDGHIEAER